LGGGKSKVRFEIGDLRFEKAEGGAVGDRTRMGRIRRKRLNHGGAEAQRRKERINHEDEKSTKKINNRDRIQEEGNRHEVRFEI